MQGYWQSAIAAKPSAAHTGYLMGGIMWFCIPFTLATTMGLSALALDLPVTVEEAGSGDPQLPCLTRAARLPLWAALHGLVTTPHESCLYPLRCPRAHHMPCILNVCMHISTRRGILELAL